MDVIRNLIDFKIRRNFEGEPLCQAYVNYEEGLLCQEKYDLGIGLLATKITKVVKIFGHNIGLENDCCRFCKRHSLEIFSKLALLATEKGFSPAINYLVSTLTGFSVNELTVPSIPEFLADNMKAKELLKSKDGGRRRKINKRKPSKRKSKKKSSKRRRKSRY